MSDEIQVEATVIDTPAVLSEAQKWLGAKSREIEKKASEYTLFEITSRETYKDMKQCKANANKDIKKFDDERKSMTRSIEQEVKAFKANAKDALRPLQDAVDDYSAAIESYEDAGLAERERELKDRWEQETPDLAQNIYWETFRKKFETVGKWLNFGTPSGRVAKSYDDAIEQTMSDLTTLRTVSRDEAELVAVLTEYYKTLDLAETVRNARERREAEEAVAAQERERKEWEAQQVPTPAPTIEQDVTDEDVIAAGAPEPEVAPESERVYTYVVTVPASKLQEFISAMKAIPGVHGTSQK